MQYVTMCFRFVCDSHQRTHHPSTKLVLYANLHDTLNARRKELEQREDALKEARVALVRDGGNVVAGGFGGPSVMGMVQKIEDDD